MHISTVDGVFSTLSKAVDVGDLVEWLKANATDKPKDKAPLWSPTSFVDNSRKQDKAHEVCALVFDFDHGRAWGEVLKAAKVGHAWHTTASHTANSPKWRLVIPLERPIAGKDWVSFWNKAVGAMGVTGHDPACNNVGRFYYVPPVAAQWEVYEGKPLPVDEILKSEDKDVSFQELKAQIQKARNPDYVESIRKALAGEPAFEAGNRDNGVTGLGFYLGRAVVAPGVVCDAVLTALGRGLSLPGPEPKEHWEKKFKAAFERGRQARQAAEAESKEKQGLNSDWAKQLQTVSRMDGSVTVISNAFNASIILKNEGTYTFRKNLLEDCIEVCGEEDWRRLTDVDVTNVTNWLQEKYRIGLGKLVVYDQIEAVASDYDPLRVYVQGLQWDGHKRMDRLLVDFLGCEDTPQAFMYSRKWLIGLVARAMEPGCKMDNVLVLQGNQGLGKSTGLRLLVDPWFSDSKFTVGDKDSMLVASRSWVHEFAELASLKRADLETVKNFFTSQFDTFRPPYGRAVVRRPRRCVFVATTNEAEFLVDSTGARRFWVVSTVKRVDFKSIVHNRDQIIAEAYAAYRLGERWYLDTEAELNLQEETVSEYQIDDDSMRRAAIRDWWQVRTFQARPEYLTTAQVIRDIWDVPPERANRALEVSAGKVLRDLGFKRVRLLKDNMRVWVYRPSLEFEKLPQRGTNGEVKDFKKEQGHG